MKKTLLSVLVLTICIRIVGLTGFADTSTDVILDETLPVELSSFSCTFTVDQYVKISWTAQSETGLLGYYVCRSENSNLDQASLVSPLVNARNTAIAQSYDYMDTELFDSGVYYYWLLSVDMDGVSHYYGPRNVIVSLGDEPYAEPDIPLACGISSIYPNPFNPSTTISFILDKAALVSLEVYNIKGQMVWSCNVFKAEAGRYQMPFNGMDSQGLSLASGIYTCIMKANNVVSTQKMVLVK